MTTGMGALATTTPPASAVDAARGGTGALLSYALSKGVATPLMGAAIGGGVGAFGMKSHTMPQRVAAFGAGTLAGAGAVTLAMSAMVHVHSDPTDPDAATIASAGNWGLALGTLMFFAGAGLGAYAYRK
jgi:hypothetical protein